MKEFIDNIKILINALGFKVLDPVIKSDIISNQDDDILYISSGNVDAKGMVTTEGFVVFAGTLINEKTLIKSLSPGMARLREGYLNSERVIDFKTTEDILFSSSSAAGAFVTGYSVSGPLTWKNKDGKLLKEIEAEET